MKKLAIIIIFLSLLSIRSSASTFHAIIFANTDDSHIGKSVYIDLKRMEVEMTAISKSIGYSIKKYFYYGDAARFNRDNLESVIDNLNCGPDDIIFFYYSGHGGRAENENTQFPEMCLTVNEPLTRSSQLCPLHNVYSRLRNKNPRLTIVMGDLCNSIIRGYKRNDNLASKGATILSKGAYNVYRNLFVNVKGGLLAASSQPGHTSGCYQIHEDGQTYEAGGYMTHSFLTMLQYCVSQSREVSWDGLMKGTITLTQELTSAAPTPQTPIYKSEITIATPPAISNNINTPPQQPALSNDDATNQRDKLAYSLSMVCSQEVPKLDRIHNIDAAKKYFAGSQARVQVIGADNRTIVNTCGIDSYLNYLSIATNMTQVMVLETKENESGKITYLKVHELHYK